MHRYRHFARKCVALQEKQNPELTRIGRLIRIGENRRHIQLILRRAMVMLEKNIRENDCAGDGRCAGVACTARGLARQEATASGWFCVPVLR